MATRKSKKRPVDFDDEDAVLAEVAKDMGEDADDLKIEEDGGLAGFGEGTVYRISTGRGGREWLVAEDTDAAYKLAVAAVKQNLEHEPQMFGADLLASHINMDRLRRDLHSDVASGHYDRLESLDAEDFWREAEGEGLSPKYVVNWDNPHASGTLSGEYDDENDAEAAGADWKAEMVAADDDPEEAEDAYGYEVVLRDPTSSEIDDLAERMADGELRDPMQYLADIYGDKEAVEQAIKIAGIDEDAAAEDAVDTDGWEHFLSRYDGNSYETASRFVYWREN